MKRGLNDRIRTSKEHLQDQLKASRAFQYLLLRESKSLQRELLFLKASEPPKTAEKEVQMAYEMAKFYAKRCVALRERLTNVLAEFTSYKRRNECPRFVYKRETRRKSHVSQTSLGLSGRQAKETVSTEWGRQRHPIFEKVFIKNHKKLRKLLARLREKYRKRCRFRKTLTLHFGMKETQKRKKHSVSANGCESSPSKCNEVSSSTDPTAPLAIEHFMLAFQNCQVLAKLVVEELLSFYQLSSQRDAMATACKEKETLPSEEINTAPQSVPEPDIVKNPHPSTNDFSKIHPNIPPVAEPSIQSADLTKSLLSSNAEFQKYFSHFPDRKEDDEIDIMQALLPPETASPCPLGCTSLCNCPVSLKNMYEVIPNTPSDAASNGDQYVNSPKSVSSTDTNDIIIVVDSDEDYPCLSQTCCGEFCTQTSFDLDMDEFMQSSPSDLAAFIQNERPVQTCSFENTSCQPLETEPPHCEPVGKNSIPVPSVTSSTPFQPQDLFTPTNARDTQKAYSLKRFTALCLLDCLLHFNTPKSSTSQAVAQNDVTPNPWLPQTSTESLSSPFERLKQCMHTIVTQSYFSMYVLNNSSSLHEMLPFLTHPSTLLLSSDVKSDEVPTASSPDPSSISAISEFLRLAHLLSFSSTNVMHGVSFMKGNVPQSSFDVASLVQDLSSVDLLFSSLSQSQVIQCNMMQTMQSQNISRDCQTFITGNVVSSPAVEPPSELEHSIDEHSSEQKEWDPNYFSITDEDIISDIESGALEIITWNNPILETSFTQLCEHVSDIGSPVIDEVPCTLSVIPPVNTVVCEEEFQCPYEPTIHIHALTYRNMDIVTNDQLELHYPIDVEQMSPPIHSSSIEISNSPMETSTNSSDLHQVINDHVSDECLHSACLNYAESINDMTCFQTASLSLEDFSHFDSFEVTVVPTTDEESLTNRHPVTISPQTISETLHVDKKSFEIPMMAMQIPLCTLNPSRSDSYSGESSSTADPNEGSLQRLEDNHSHVSVSSNGVSSNENFPDHKLNQNDVESSSSLPVFPTHSTESSDVTHELSKHAPREKLKLRININSWRVCRNECENESSYFPTTTESSFLPPVHDIHEMNRPQSNEDQNVDKSVKKKSSSKRKSSKKKDHSKSGKKPRRSRSSVKRPRCDFDCEVVASSSLIQPIDTIIPSSGFSQSPLTGPLQVRVRIPNLYPSEYIWQNNQFIKNPYQTVDSVVRDSKK